VSNEKINSIPSLYKILLLKFIFSLSIIKKKKNKGFFVPTIGTSVPTILCGTTNKGPLAYNNFCCENTRTLHAYTLRYPYVSPHIVLLAIEKIYTFTITVSWVGQ